MDNAIIPIFLNARLGHPIVSPSIQRWLEEGLNGLAKLWLQMLHRRYLSFSNFLGTVKILPQLGQYTCLCDSMFVSICSVGFWIRGFSNPQCLHVVAFLATNLPQFLHLYAIIVYIVIIIYIKTLYIQNKLTSLFHRIWVDKLSYKNWYIKSTVLSVNIHPQGVWRYLPIE